MCLCVRGSFCFHFSENETFVDTKVKMVDWATQNRLYPPGYCPIDVRYRRVTIDSSLPFSLGSSKSKNFLWIKSDFVILCNYILGHNCRLRKKTLKNLNSKEILFENLHQGLNQAFHFHDNMSADGDDDRSDMSNLNWSTFNVYFKLEIQNYWPVTFQI